jgi:hypothetical protein
VNLSAQQQFTATVTGQSNNAVTWEVNGTAGGTSTAGTIDNTGLYTAPSAIPNPSTVSVTAVSQADSTQSGNAAVTIGDVTINQGSQAVPIKLGTSGGNENDKTTKFCCSGTLGSLVVRAGTFYILSNSHVLARSGQAVAGEPVDQPGLVDTNCSPKTLVANFTQAAPLQNGPMNVDAAIAAIVTGQVDTTGAILQLGTVSGGIPQPAPPANTVATAAINMPIAKSGRTTGLSCGTVQATNVSVSVDYSTSCGGATTSTIVYDNQVLTSGNFSDAGDSGSLIVEATTAQPLALLYAGDTTGAAVGNPIQQVLDAFTDSKGNHATIVGTTTPHQVSGCTGMAAQPGPVLASAQQQLFQAAMPAAIAVKGRHQADLMSDPAVLAVGIGDSGTPGQPAIVVAVERGKPHRAIPSTLEGIPIRIITTGRFKANDWDPNVPKQCSAGKKQQTAILPMK